MKARSIKGNSADEIKTALEQSMTGDFKPTLALVFTSIEIDRKSVRKLLDDAGIGIFGATTNGEFIDEETGQGNVAILLLDMNPDHFNILFDEYPDKNYREKASELAKRSLERFTHPAFLISCSNTETDAVNFAPKVSIGINSGEMISGNIGSANLRRLDYTVIGDAVNTAQRLQAAAGPGQVIISGSSYEKVKESFNCSRVGEITMKNKSKPLMIYEVMD